MRRFKNILFVATRDSSGDAALERAATLAANNQACLTVIEVLEAQPSNSRRLNLPLSSEELQALMVVEHEKGLAERVAPWRRKVIEIQTKVLIGIPFLSIIRAVLRDGHDLVIKTAESGGLLDRVLGSDDMHLLRKCPCAVWLIKPELSKPYRQILAAVDVDTFYSPDELHIRHELNGQILEMAISIALSESAELHIVHAWDALFEGILQGSARATETEVFAYVENFRQNHQQNLNILMDETISKLGKSALEYVIPQTHLLKGSPRREIPVFADEIESDLVVMGTVARTGIAGFFMGNTAETILNQLNCSVLAIKPLGFVSPVTLED